jgi:hypothetical protein
MTDKVLLIGNGVNNADGDHAYRWNDLVNDLIKEFSKGKKISSADKPFPLLYEEIFAAAIGGGKVKESEIKKFIADKTFNIINPNTVHEGLVQLQFKNILTTNYDYNLEFGIKSDYKSYINKGLKKEKLYSLYRHHSLNEINFWHIHGEARLPQSINLGYEQYGGYLQFIRNYLINGIDDKGKKTLRPLIYRLRYPVKEIYSWVDFFFTRDIYIIGLTLAMDEMHLWWLLSFRNRLKLTTHPNITNTITYFYPKAFSVKAKLDLMQSLGVKTICINAAEKKFYGDVMKQLA